MRLGEFGRSSATLTLTADELVIVNNALNEICNGVNDLDDEGEFETRVGASREAVRTLLAEIHGVMERARHLPSG